MGNKKELILIVDDDEESLDHLERMLRRRGHPVVRATSGEEALAEMANSQPSIVFLDLVMPGMDGLAVLESLMQDYPDTIVIIVSAHAGREMAVRAGEMGAYDYLMKPARFAEIDFKLSRALEHERTIAEVKRLREEFVEKQELGSIIGGAKGLRPVFDDIDRIAPSDCSVFLTGKRGSGKEMVARLIHARSMRATEPYVVVNCAALVERLVESELFGTVHGVGTDLIDRAGYFEEADGGTIFLDEVVEIPLEHQPALNRVVDNKEIRRVGGKNRPINVRIISAAQDPEGAMDQNKFRRDLYDRLATHVIHVPPLREHLEDIPDLVKAYLPRCGRENKVNARGITDDALQLLMQYDFPGNVRELIAIIDRAVLLVRDDEGKITHEHVAAQISVRSPVIADIDNDAAWRKKIAQNNWEKRYWTLVFHKAQGNKECAAEIAGVSKKTIERACTDHDLHLEDFVEK